MPKEDLLSKQINQLGFFLRKVFEKMTGRIPDDNMAEIVFEVNAGLKEAMGFDFGEIRNMSVEEVVPFLMRYDYFSAENLELFADILSKINSEDLCKKALRIYEYIDTMTATFSMERNLKMKAIKERFV